MSKNEHINLSAYDKVEELSNFTQEEFELYCDDKLKGCDKHISYFKNIFSQKKDLKVCEIGSGNSKLLYALDKEKMLQTGLAIEISESRHLFAQKFKEYMKNSNVKNINQNIFDIDPVSDYDVVIAVDVVMQLISPLFEKSEEEFLKWSYDSLKVGGVIILELWSFQNILQQLKFSDESLNLWTEFPKSDPFEYLLSKVYLNENSDICWDKTFLKRDSNEKSLFSNVLRPYSKEDIEKKLLESGFENISFSTKWAEGSASIEDVYIVRATKKEKK